MRFCFNTNYELKKLMFKKTPKYNEPNLHKTLKINTFLRLWNKKRTAAKNVAVLINKNLFINFGLILNNYFNNLDFVTNF